MDNHVYVMNMIAKLQSQTRAVGKSDLNMFCIDPFRCVQVLLGVELVEQNHYPG